MAGGFESIKVKDYFSWKFLMVGITGTLIMIVVLLIFDLELTVLVKIIIALIFSFFVRLIPASFREEILLRNATIHSEDTDSIPRFVGVCRVVAILGGVLYYIHI